MADRDTYKYILKDGNEIVDYGITNDLERREQEHRNEGLKFTKMQKVGIATTREGAGAWEEASIQHYKDTHGGRRPRYNQNDSGK